MNDCSARSSYGHIERDEKLFLVVSLELEMDDQEELNYFFRKLHYCDGALVRWKLLEDTIFTMQGIQERREDFWTLEGSYKYEEVE